MRQDWPEWLLYVLGVASGAFVGFFSPLWYLGFAPLCAGFVFAALALDVVKEVPGGSPPTQRNL
jgi:hypothetical protein